MKVAVLGTGFGAYHTELYSKMKEVDEIIVWGRNEGKLNELAKKFSVKTTTIMDDIFNDETIELIDICLPNKLHKEMAIKAFEAGKNVFLEMPLAESLEDGKAIVEAAKKHNKRLFVDLFLRHEYAYEKLISIIKEEKYGKVKHLRINRLTPPWWGDLSLEKIGLNLMHHDIDFIVNALGKPADISAAGVNVRENQSIVTASFVYENALAICHASSSQPGSAPFSVAFDVVFENAYVRYFEDGYADGKLETKFEVFTNDKVFEEALETPDCYQAVIKDVVESIEKAIPSTLDGENAFKTLEAICDMNKCLL